MKGFSQDLVNSGGRPNQSGVNFNIPGGNSSSKAPNIVPEYAPIKRESSFVKGDAKETAGGKKSMSFGG